MTKPLRVLVVEDSEDDALLLVRELQRNDYEVECERVETGEAMAAALENQAWDIIIADYALPHFSGLEALKLLQQSALDLPFIIVSGKIGEDVAVEAMKAGAHDYIMKGNLARLAPAVERELREAEVRRERKRAEEALRRSNRHLEQALTELRRTQAQVAQEERLRALGQLASGIAHDFNNALVPISGFSELLLAQPQYQQDKKKLTEYLRGINTAAQDAAGVVSRLREFYRKREGETDHLPVKLHDIVAQAISLTQPRWKDEAEAASIAIDIETDLQEGPPILGNEAELREVLVNLILNAVDAMLNGGTITIRTRLDGKDAVVEVSDTGVGMSEDVRQRCFEPFFSTKGKGGTGMGLAMVYGTIQRHEGTIDVESEQGKGTTFFIRLPARKARKAKTKKKAPASTTPLHVLLVDDEPSVLQVVTAFLTSDGHTVETATNGREGLEKLRAGTLDLVVTDRAMPGMSGDQLAAAIKTIRPTPVILLTGFGDMMHVTGEKPAGVDLIVSKPVSLAALRQAVAKVISKQIPRRSKVVGDTTTGRTTPTPEIRSRRRSP